jgi:hypothetical protein
MTGYGRHAARKPPGLLVKLAVPTGFALLLGLALGGWMLFSHTPTDAALLQGTDSLTPPTSRPTAAPAPPAPTPTPVAPPQTVKTFIESELPELLPKSAEVVMALVGPVSRLNWAAMARCESRGNPRSASRAGYYGLYQFSMPAWKSVGGTGRPSDATVAEQTMRAQMLFLKRGRNWQGQWPACGHHLFG